MNKWDFIKENYIDRGLKIFPVEKNGKKPLIENWQNDCSCDYFQVLYWFTTCKDCNWGLPCTPNNLFVLDLDVHDENKNGIENYNLIIKSLYSDEGYLDDISECIQKTPSGGNHIIFNTDNELKNVSNGSNVFEKYPGIDIRTDGYIVVQPSIINDSEYKYITIDGCSPKIMNEKLKNFIIENANLKSDCKKEPYKKPTSVSVGDRDNQLFNYINNIYFKTNLEYDEVLCLANHFNETILEEPFSEKDVVYKVKKAFKKDRSCIIHIKISEE